MFPGPGPLMAQNPRVPVVETLRHAWFKAGLFALLTLNAAIYVASGTLSEALDSISWLALLVLYEFETDFGLGAHGGWAAGAVRGTRLVAAAGIVVAAVGYTREREWLDAINAGLWIAIVAMYEWQVRAPAMAARRQERFTVAACLIYGGLALLVAAWIWRREWFDAYDALLWLAALVVIELNILRAVGRAARV